MAQNTILTGLNPQQKEAVTDSTRVLRILAGAGSGKTSVLIRKIQWFLAVEKFLPEQILALTFTNKAAKEIKERLKISIPNGLEKIWLGTFHSICHQILRRHIAILGWSEKFSIIDSDDQLSLIKKLMKTESFDESICSPPKMLEKINYFKDNALRAKDIPITDFNSTKLQKFYQTYEDICRQQNLVDFTELLSLTIDLFHTDHQLRIKYQKYFRAILVDEFQDTNELQYKLIQLLMTKETRLLVVGDDDQSIYGWRGAKIEHILRLEEDFPALKTILLEQNYRSSKIILHAANAVISHNSNRLKKSLWTAKKGGEKILVFPAINEVEEALFVCQQIKKWQNQGKKLSECAILYRFNAQSRIFESILLQNQIPYSIFGGLRFFARTEIKHVLAYLRLSQIPNDNHTFERIINFPPRGVGEKTLEQLRLLAQKSKLSYWQVLSNPNLLTKYFKKRAQNTFKNFMRLIETIQKTITEQQTLEQVIQLIIHQSGIFQKYQQEGTEKSLERCKNLQELIYAVRDYQGENLSEQIERFLAEAALNTSGEAANCPTDSVQLMTLHSAKGLEFEQVFLVGLEEGVFPASFSEELEEERRLAYVGITRAKHQLNLSFTTKRNMEEGKKSLEPSRFLEEIPDDLLSFTSDYQKSQFLHLCNKAEVCKFNTITGIAGFSLGDQVSHPRFGIGEIVRFEGKKEHARAAILFSTGEKILVLAYANLEKM